MSGQMTEQILTFSAAFGPPRVDATLLGPFWHCLVKPGGNLKKKRSFLSLLAA